MEGALALRLLVATASSPQEAASVYLHGRRAAKRWPAQPDIHAAACVAAARGAASADVGDVASFIATLFIEHTASSTGRHPVLLVAAAAAVAELSDSQATKLITAHPTLLPAAMAWLPTAGDADASTTTAA